MAAIIAIGVVNAPTRHAAPTHAAGFASKPCGGAHGAKNCQATENNDLALVFRLASANHDAIEAIAAIAAVGAAIWLALVTGALHTATRDLAESTEDLAKGAEDQVAEMRLARGLAEKQHELAEKQFLITCKSADNAEKQHALARLKYIAEHRPRIKVRSIGIARRERGGMFEAAEPIVGGLVIWNDGAADAVILETCYRFFITQRDLPMLPPMNEPGMVRTLIAEMPHTLDGHGSLIVDVGGPALGARAPYILQGIERLYLMGAIRYADWDEKERWMGFCRLYEPPERPGSDGRFVAVDNPDYEFSD